ncbi:hypothetical protein BH11PSE12_BH11PSE12_33360 [soil metagenome]
MSVEPSPTTSSETLTEQASKLLHGHVNSIKSKLGLDNANSPLGKVAAHTKRKLAELEAARAAGVKAAPGSPDWQAAMKPESFGKGFVKANRTQFLITAGVFSLGLFWLLVIRFVHHDANASQTGTSEAAQSAMANRQMAGMAPVQQAIMPAAPAASPTGFGSPNSGFGVPNSSNSYQQTQPMPLPMQQASALQYPVAPQALQFAPGAQQPIQMMPAPQMYSPYAPQPQGYSMHAQASNYVTQPSNLYPARQHSAARHQVVVNR